ncbi:77 kDa echinoderm microtubule-associated protein-like isoform X3 [Patiria miniata]|uniref:Echinoderm microtubule-associated protein-like 2 n=1 Tax=Patiria miniata TaxID=46514 RepID=A0A914B5E9_PATMI|nr:77 kDa echinoderm microtubule-associated protein-like isoform X3 [Patiria miniata]
MADDLWNFGSGRDLWDTSELYEVDSIEGEVGNTKASRQSQPLIKLAHKGRAKRPKPFEEFLYPTNPDVPDYGFDLYERVAKLEGQVKDQEDEITCLKAALADVVRRLATLESCKNSQRGFLSHSPLPSRPPMYNDVTKSRTKILLSPATPESQRRGRTGSFGSNSSGSDGKLRKWGSQDSYSFPTSGSPRKSASMTNIHKAGEINGARPRPSKEALYNPDEGWVRIYMRGRPITMFMPTEAGDFSVKAKQEPPAEKLKLEWVYGYRGKDCRTNLHILPTGDIVYFMAAVVILHNVQENTQRHYMGHNDDVKCIAIHPNTVTIASGQVAGHDKDEGKPHVRIWDSVNLNTLHVLGLGFFDRAVCCVGFSKCDKGVQLLAIDDSNDHVLSVWNWEKEKKLADSKSSGDPVVAAEFHPLIENQMVSCGKGHLLFWTLDNNKVVKKAGIFEKKHDKPKFVLCFTFAGNGDLLTGDSNGNIFIWAKGSNRISQAIKAHEGQIFSLVMLQDGRFLSGGGKDRKVHIFDTSYDVTVTLVLPESTGPCRCLCPGKDKDIYVGTTRNAILHGDMEGETFTPDVVAHTDECWGLAVHPNQSLFLTCAYDKHVIMWDAEQHRPLWMKTMEEDPCQSACFHPNGGVVALGMKTGRWMVLDAQNQDLVTVHTDGNEQHDIVRYSPDGNYLAVASHDNYIYIYAVTEEGRKYSKVGRCSGHSSFVTHIDWSADSNYLVSNSGDYEILYWKAENCRQIPSATSMRDTEWATFTCVFGFPVCGIWQEGSDGTDINSACRSHSGAILATGDDFGKINLFSYPVTQPKAGHNSNRGHSSHVTAVEFSSDDTRLFSTGGRDMSCMQWKVV